jgi:RNA recognition motif-containing protein
MPQLVCLIDGPIYLHLVKPPCLPHGQPFVIAIQGVRMNIYVGNLSPDTTEGDLREAFAAFGQVATATIVKDRFSGESRGFAFVEMPTRTEAQNAINGLNGKMLKGRTMNVNEARPRTESGGMGGGGRRNDNRGGGNRRGGANARRW